MYQIAILVALQGKDTALKWVLAGSFAINKWEVLEAFFQRTQNSSRVELESMDNLVGSLQMSYFMPMYVSLLLLLPTPLRCFSIGRREHFPLLANAPKRPNNFRARRNLCSNSGESCRAAASMATHDKHKRADSEAPRCKSNRENPPSFFPPRFFREIPCVF